MITLTILGYVVLCFVITMNEYRRAEDVYEYGVFSTTRNNPRYKNLRKSLLFGFTVIPVRLLYFLVSITVVAGGVYFILKALGWIAVNMP